MNIIINQSVMCEVGGNKKLLPLPREGGSRLVRRSSKSEGGSETEGFSADPKQLFTSLTEITVKTPFVPADGATSP